MRAEEPRYYELRAPEYDDWYLGRGLHERVERPRHEVYKRYFASEELAGELGGRMLHAGDRFVVVSA